MAIGTETPETAYGAVWTNTVHMTEIRAVVVAVEK